MNKPIIGVCAAFEMARYAVWDQRVHLLPAPYVDALQRAGAIAVLLPLDETVEDHVDQLLDHLDGLVLAGGADIDPASYGVSDVHPETAGTVPARDRFELAVTRRATRRDLPVLGICRGMQLLNVAFGGTLLQHIPDTVGHGDHRRTPGSFADADHDVRLAPGSLAARAAGEELHGTKSHHHQGVDRIGEGFVASGWSVRDDLVEAIESPGSSFVLGVQWHPEVDPASSVVKSLVAAARDPR